MNGRTLLRMAIAMAIVAWGCAYGANITIWDESGSGTGWHGAGEDQEVEPNCLTGQQWDLEAFILNGTSLSIVGGYDFVNAVSGYNSVTRAGDLFIDTDGDAQFGTGAHRGVTYNPYQVVSDLFGYDLAMDLNFANMTFTAYDLNAGLAQVQVTTVGEQINDASNPWRYRSGGTAVATGTIQYQTGLTDAQAAALGANVVGGYHNVATVDLAWLAPYLDPGSDWAFLSHFTLECGNDNLIGVGNIPPVPEPATLGLLGLGCLGLLMRRRVAG